MINVRKLQLCIAVLVATVTTACGSGGGNPIVEPPPTATLAVDQQNAANLVSISVLGRFAANLTHLPNVMTPVSTATGRLGVRSVADTGFMATEIASLQSREATAAPALGTTITERGLLQCANGGGVSVVRSWSGQQNPVTCTQAADFAGSAFLSGCGNGVNSVMNGSIVASLPGSLCAPSAVTIVLTDFSLDLVGSGGTFSFGDLEILMSDIVRSDDGSTTAHAQTTISGDVTQVFDGIAETGEFYQYVEIVDVSVDSSFMLEISGLLRAGCLGDEWAAIDTIQPLSFASAVECPTAGELQISGTGSVTVVFNADGSVDVGSDHYASCEDLQGICRNP